MHDKKTSILAVGLCILIAIVVAIVLVAGK